MLAARILDVDRAEPLKPEFEQCFHEHYALVFRTAYSITSNREDAEDVAQTVFLRIYRRGDFATLKANPKAYLYRSAVNQALSVIRSRRRQVHAVDAAELEGHAPSGSANQEKLRQGKLVEVLSELGAGAVEILILRYEHDYSDAEIARLLGTSRSAIAVRLFRARTRLKKLLEKPHDKT
jgi:RNA polymerase sigma-70 factor (ECF subfamily)